MMMTMKMMIVMMVMTMKMMIVMMVTMMMMMIIKTSKPCHIGIHSIALTEYSQMSAHLPGFQ